MSVHGYASGKWKANVKWGGVSYHLGIFGSEAAARAAVDAEYWRLREGSSLLLLGGAVLTIKAYAESIGVRHGTVKRWIHEGMPVRRENSLVRIDPTEAGRWVAEHRGKSVAISRRSVLYAVIRDRDGAVKLGWSSDVGRRIRELHKGLRDEMQLLAVMPGDKPDELRLHEQFRAKALGGERFAISADEAVSALRAVGERHG